VDGNLKEVEMAATGKSKAGGSSMAADISSAKPKEGARRPEPDLEAADKSKSADIDRLEIARGKKWRGR